MTTEYQESKICSICGTESLQTGLGSTNSSGPQDLDLRPPPMQRDTMHLWLEKCPHCGYINEDIEKKLRIDPEYLKSADYRLEPGTAPALALVFLKNCLLKAKAGRFDSAGWSCLHAAWVCDDAGNKELAVEQRRNAIRMFETARKRKQKFAQKKYYEDMMFVDLFRRAGDFEKAEKILTGIPFSKADPVFVEVILFQNTLLVNKDDKCHNLGEIPESLDTSTMESKGPSEVKSFNISEKTDRLAVAKQYEILRSEECPSCGLKQMKLVRQKVLSPIEDNNGQLASYTDRIECTCDVCQKTALYDFHCNITGDAP